MKHPTNRLIGAILLVAGTTIGGGVLALPVTTGLAGFFPSLLLMIAIWLFMLLTAFYLLEVNLRLSGESNLISMVHETLGRPGEVVAWLSYLLLLYSLLAAYLLGCSQILYDFFCPCFFEELPIEFLLFGLFILFGGFVYLGVERVDLFNRLLMVGLVIGYVGLIALGLPRIHFSNLLYHNVALLPISVSVIVTSFGFHIIIPTLTGYLEHDKHALKKALVWGSLIPLVSYILWQTLAMGVIPVQGELSLKAAFQEGQQATVVLRKIIGSPLITLSARCFAFFAIITSLLGVSLSLSDFLADGLKIKKDHMGKFVLMCLTFVPPLIFALFYPRGFILALNYAGLFVIVLLGILPLLMAWAERYRGEKTWHLLPSSFTVFGGKTLLLAAFAFVIVLLGVEIFV